MNLWTLLKSHLLGPYRNVLLLVVVLQTIQTFAALTLPTLNANLIDNGVLKGERLRRQMTSEGEVVERIDDGFFTISAASFHPSQRGYDAYRAALDVALATVLELTE